MTRKWIKVRENMSTRGPEYLRSLEQAIVLFSLLSGYPLIHTLLIKLGDKAPFNLYTPAIKLLWLHIAASLITADF